MLLVFGVSACLNIASAQQTTPTNPQTAPPDRHQSTKPGSDATDRTDRATSGDRTHDTTSTTRSRTATASSELMVGEPDHKFMLEAAQGGMMEVQLAQLAQQKASSDDVKEFAKELEQDHSKANENLKDLAKQKNVALPTELDQKHQAKMAKLQNMSGDQFDRAYMKMMVDDHKKNVSKFQKHSERAMDSHVKDFAAKTLPSLQGHLQKAQQLNTSTRSRKADDTSATRSDPGASSDSDKTKTGNPTPQP
jgi:putative membrane protein